MLRPGFEAVPGDAVGDWRPTRYTSTLSGTEEFTTEGDKLLRFASRYWSIPEVERFALDEWQEWLLRHLLETYPPDWPVTHLRGHLRYRQAVVSMGRQNGKSLLGALLVLYFLALHVRGPRVIGLASIDRQARIVYDRVRYGVDACDALAREIRTTGTRGITRRDGSGVYFTLPAKEESAQGEPASGVLYDELHLGLASLWDAMLLGMRARPNALMVGLTTAGDDNSRLLLRLYDEGAAAIAGEDERFGFFVWEAPDDDLTEENVIAANPAIACGRISLEVAMSDARKMQGDTRRGPDGLTGPQRVKRYTLNRFVEGAANAWASVDAWTEAAVGAVDLDAAPVVVYAADRTRDWEYAAITATARLEGDRLATELVASLVDPDRDRLLEALRALARREQLRGRAVAFALPGDLLAEVADTLKDDGLEVWKLSTVETSSAAQHAKAAIGRRAVEHPGDALLRRQFSRAVPRVTGDGWRLSRSLSGEPIDAVLATVCGLYVATVRDSGGDEPPIY